MPNKRGRYAASGAREVGAAATRRTSWVGDNTLPERAEEQPDRHPCAGGCGAMIAASKCSPCAAREVGRQLLAEGNPYARFYPEAL